MIPRSPAWTPEASVTERGLHSRLVRHGGRELTHYQIHQPDGAGRVAKGTDRKCASDEEVCAAASGVLLAGTYGAVWQPASVSPAVHRRKTLLSLRIDHDALDWFRAHGPGYQTRMNAVLRAYMEYARD